MDNFESIIDDCLKEIVAGRETLESCLRRYPAHAARLAPALEVAERLRRLPAAPVMPVDKRRVLETRYLKRATQLQARATQRAVDSQRGMRRRGLMPVIVAFLVCLILVTAVTTASASVPGDALYPVKRVTEQVRLTLTSGPLQAALHLNLAQERLVELRTLAERREVPTNLLTEISVETAVVLQQIPSLPLEQQQTLLVQLTEFNDRNSQVLQSVAAFATGDTQISVQAALADSTAKQNQAKAMFASIKILPDSPPSAEKGPRLTPAGIENRPTQVDSATKKSTLQPSATDELEAPPTPRPTDKASPNPEKPTPKIEHTPPGQRGDVKPTHQPPERPTKKPPNK